MPSGALLTWQSARNGRLDELEAAHGKVGGSGRGRRFATLQLNRAYTIVVASEFQGFCRELHDEAALFLANRIGGSQHRNLLAALFTQRRQLDRGNAQPDNLEQDFGRLGMNFWSEVAKVDARNTARKAVLEELNKWRNALVHSDPSKLQGGDVVWLRDVQGWRRTCEMLAPGFDEAVARHCLLVVGARPW
jgi:hypothetical protein